MAKKGVKNEVYQIIDYKGSRFQGAKGSREKTTDNE
jgi:hypothetical protein